MEIYSKNAMGILDQLHTERLEYHSEYLPLADAIQVLEAYEDTGLEPEEVAALAKAKENGRLLVLPCGIGDTVYQVAYCNDICPHINNSGKCEKCDFQFAHKYTVVETPFSFKMLSRWKVDFFLTREEAEAALKGEKE